MSFLAGLLGTYGMLTIAMNRKPARLRPASTKLVDFGWDSSVGRRRQMGSVILRPVAIIQHQDGVLGEDGFAWSIQPRNDCMIHSAKTTFPLSLPWLALQTRLGRPRNPHNDTHNHSPSSGRGSKLV